MKTQGKDSDSNQVGFMEEVAFLLNVDESEIDGNRRGGKTSPAGRAWAWVVAAPGEGAVAQYGG